MSDDVNEPTTETDEAPVSFSRTFSNGAFVFRYCYDECKLIQILTAKAAFQFAQNQMAHPPRTLDELEKTGQTDFLAKAMAKLLRQVASDGELVPWTKQNSRKMESDAFDFIANLEAADCDALEACKRDFFGRANLIDAESIAQYKAQLEQVSGVLGFAQQMKATMTGSDETVSVPTPSMSFGHEADTNEPLQPSPVSP